MLDNETIKKIEDFCVTKPRSIQEIAKHLKKNWRTIDRYITAIKKEYGTLDTRTFREGTRGALKIVYYSAVENFSGTVFQQELEKDIFKGREKTDFAAFDIFQFIAPKEKEVWVGRGVNECKTGRLKEFRKILEGAKKQILFFSGNLSFINFKDKESNIFNVLEELVKKGVSMKIVCRVDIGGIKNVRKMLSLNHKYGKELIKIRHRNQPLRATIIDDTLVNINEIKEPSDRVGEFDEKIFLFYAIKNKPWIKWLTQIFWRMYNSSISSEKRLEEIEKLSL